MRVYICLFSTRGFDTGGLNMAAMPVKMCLYYQNTQFIFLVLIADSNKHLQRNTIRVLLKIEYENNRIYLKKKKKKTHPGTVFTKI